MIYLLLRQGQKQNKKPEVKLYLTRLLVLLALVDRPRFCLMLETLALGLTVGLVIHAAELIGREIAISLSEWS